MILILDLNNMAYRALYSFHLSHKGKDTSITYGVMRMITALIRKYEPEAIIACFDGGTPPYRRAIWPEYKKHRKKDPTMQWHDVYRQLDELRDFLLPVHGIMTLHGRGIEADDFMYHASKMVIGQEVYIVTTDDDLLQAVDGRTSVLNPSKDLLITIDNFEEVMEGIPAEGYLIYKSMRGDHSDNIPGVYGVGHKTALKVIIEYFTQPLLHPGGFRLNDQWARLGRFQRQLDKPESKLAFDIAYKVMDLSYDMVGAHKIILRAEWNSANAKLMKKCAFNNGFMSLLEQGGEYTGPYIKLTKPEFDRSIRHPIPQLMPKMPIILRGKL